MLKYMIYHVPGKKVGCTTSMKRVKTQNAEVIFSTDCIKMASMVEISQQQMRGYQVDSVLYSETAERFAGIPKTKKHRQKISKANKGNVLSDETRKKMSSAGKTKVFTAEHRANLSKAARLRHSKNKGGDSESEQR